MTFWNRFPRLAVYVACAFAVTSLPSALHAQVTATAPAAPISETEDQRVDILGGAAYSHFNPGYAHQVQATNLLGWQGAVTGWFSPLFGIEGSVRGVYGTYTLPAGVSAYPSITATTSPLSEYLFLFGPSFRLYQSPRYTAGAHLLGGGANGTFDSAFRGTGVQPFQVGVYNSQLTWAVAIGGWADYKVTPRFAVRFTGDYQPTHYAKQGQNEFFGSVGIVYKLGRRGHR